MPQTKFPIKGATGDTGRGATEILIKQGFFRQMRCAFGGVFRSQRGA